MSGLGVDEEDVSRRRVFKLRTPADEPCTVIVTRQGFGAAATVWLSFHGTAQATAVAYRCEAVELGDAIRGAAA